LTLRAKAPIAVAACSLLAGLGLPALGRADGGGGPGSGGAGFSSSSSPGPTAQPGNGQVSSSASGITITTQQSAFLTGQLQFSGSVPSSDAGNTVEIQRYGHETGWTWAPTAEGTVASNGSFQVTWSVNHIGRFAFRAVMTGSGQGATASAGWPTVTVTVYRSSLATQYGPGFYGRLTACGQRLRRNTLGVANRRLPCGTKVAIYYNGRTIVVPVIDRGPFANGADWDLTEATGRALGIAGTAQIGAVSLPRTR